MSTSVFPSVVLMAVYFGKLPDMLPLWARSCAFNNRYKWILFTDDETTRVEWPVNVEVHHLTLDRLRNLLSKQLGFRPNLQTPYKACDYRPLYWILLDEYGLNCDFWGHCDLDMIFGRLDSFITAEHYRRFDRVLAVGHLSIYRNAPEVNNMYKLSTKKVSHVEVFSRSSTFGFDEHNGINEIWRTHRRSFYENEAIIADIDPQLGQFRTQIPFQNTRRQVFIFDEGRTYHIRRVLGSWRKREVLYVHFQKRRLPKFDQGCLNQPFAIGPEGFTPLGGPGTLPGKLANLNLPSSMAPIRHMVRRWRSALRIVLSKSSM